MGTKDRPYRIVNSMAALVSFLVGIIMILALVQAMMVVPDAKQLVWGLLLSVAVVITSIVFLVTEIRRRPKGELGGPGDHEA